MAYFLNERRKREQRRRVFKSIRNLVLFIIPFFTTYLGFQIGLDRNKQNLAYYQETIQQLKENRSKLEASNTSLEMKISKLTNEYGTLKNLFDNQVLDQNQQKILELIQTKKTEGITEKHLLNLIKTTKKPHDCTDYITKRFRVLSQLSENTTTSASFYDGTVAVTGEGESALNNEGKPEFWFDTLKPVRVSFTTVGNKTDVSEGVLPLNHNIIIDNHMYQFLISPSDFRGFASIASRKCSIR